MHQMLSLRSKHFVVCKLFLMEIMCLKIILEKKIIWPMLGFTELIISQTNNEERLNVSWAVKHTDYETLPRASNSRVR